MRVHSSEQGTKISKWLPRRLYLETFKDVPLKYDKMRVLSSSAQGRYETTIGDSTDAGAPGAKRAKEATEVMDRSSEFAKPGSAARPSEPCGSSSQGAWSEHLITEPEIVPMGAPRTECREAQREIPASDGSVPCRAHIARYDEMGQGNKDACSRFITLALRGSSHMLTSYHTK